jgi:hypothetical protein
MKQGDLVEAKLANTVIDGILLPPDGFIGVILRQMNFKDHRLKTQRDVFSILWQDGKVRSEWSCNLDLVARL